MKMAFHSLANKTHLHIKGFALVLVLKQRQEVTRKKWPIEQFVPRPLLVFSSGEYRGTPPYGHLVTMATFVLSWRNVHAFYNKKTSFRKRLPRLYGQQPHREIPTSISLYIHPVNCWFASDVSAAMLVVKNKSISLLWEMNSILMQI